MKTTIVSALFIACIVLASCSSTELLTSWKAPNASLEKYKKVLVIGMMGSKDIQLRQSTEEAMVKSLSTKGVNANSAYDQYGPAALVHLSDSDLLRKVKTEGIDGVMLISLLDRTQEKNYVPGYFTSTPYAAYYGRWERHYVVVYDRIYNPGYFVSTTNYVMEANFYNAITDQLRYSAQTKSYDPASAQTLGNEFTTTVVNDLVTKGVLSK